MSLPSLKQQEERASMLQKKITSFFLTNISKGTNPYKKINKFTEEDNYLTISEFELAIKHALHDFVSKVAEDEEIRPSEMENFKKFLEFSNDFSEKVTEGKATNFYYSILFWEIIDQLFRGIKNGELIEKKAPSNISLSKTEKIIFIYDNVTGHKLNTKVKYKGSSTGASKRLGKGWTVRHSRFQGEPVSYTEWEKTGKGQLVITNKNVILTSEKPIKERYSKIVSFEATNDGVIINTSLKTRPAVRFNFTPSANYKNIVNTQSWSLMRFLAVAQQI